MLAVNPDADKIAKKVTDLMLKIQSDFQRLKPDLREDYNKGAAMISFRLGLDYFATARDAIYKGRIVSGGAVTRAAIENLADLYYVYDKPNKYAKAYVESMAEFQKAMLAAAGKKTTSLYQSRELNQANKWTQASVFDRVNASGKSLVLIYDLLSYFSHPNPGSLTYITNTKLHDSQLNLMQQGNCITALSLMKLVLNHSDVTSIERNDLEQISQDLGLPI